MHNNRVKISLIKSKLVIINKKAVEARVAGTWIVSEIKCNIGEIQAAYNIGNFKWSLVFNGHWYNGRDTKWSLQTARNLKQVYKPHHAMILLILRQLIRRLRPVVSGSIWCGTVDRDEGGFIICRWSQRAQTIEHLGNRGIEEELTTTFVKLRLLTQW